MKRASSDREPVDFDGSLGYRIPMSKTSLASKTSEHSAGMTIGVLARAAGVPISTVRYYERVEILRPMRRSAANYRLYSSEDLQRLRFIRAAQEIGFTLDDIPHLFQPDPCEDVQHVIEARLASVDARMSALSLVRDVLRSSLEQCRDHEASGRCAVVAELSSRSERR